MKDSVSFRLNGKPVRLEVDGSRSLLWVLRTDLGLTGTKFGCGASLCGACTVVVGKEAVRSCLLPVKAVAARTSRRSKDSSGTASSTRSRRRSRTRAACSAATARRE